MGNPVWFIFWLLVLIFISWWVASFCAFWYIIVYTLTLCFPGLADLANLLLKGVQFVHYCADGMLNCKSLT